MLRLAADENFNNDIAVDYCVGSQDWTLSAFRTLVFREQTTRRCLNGQRKRDVYLLTHDVTTITRYAYGSATRLGQRTRSLSLWHTQASARAHSMNGERLLNGNETQGADQVFTETSLPTFPYRLRGISGNESV